VAIVASAHLIERGGKKCCSVCHTVFANAGDLSISKAFIAHIREKHKPVESEKLNQQKAISQPAGGLP
jgi:hypothetical protein